VGYPSISGRAVSQFGIPGNHQSLVKSQDATHLTKGRVALTTNKTRNINDCKIGFIRPSSRDTQCRATQPAECSRFLESTIEYHFSCLSSPSLEISERKLIMLLRTCLKTNSIVDLFSSALLATPFGCHSLRAFCRSGASSVAGIISNLTFVPMSEEVL
jgi:hypothetical protein